jgi:hypothetical protein
LQREVALKRQVARAEVAALSGTQDAAAVAREAEKRAEEAEAEAAELAAEVDMLREGMKVMKRSPSPSAVCASSSLIHLALSVEMSVHQGMRCLCTKL